MAKKIILGANMVCPFLLTHFCSLVSYCISKEDGTGFMHPYMRLLWSVFWVVICMGYIFVSIQVNQKYSDKFSLISMIVGIAVLIVPLLYYCIDMPKQITNLFIFITRESIQVGYPACAMFISTDVYMIIKKVCEKKESSAVIYYIKGCLFRKN